MPDRKDLDAAAQAGILRPEQVAQLQDFLANNQAGVAPAGSGEENLRFIRNFHDVFLAIGIALLAIGMGVAIGVTVASSGPENPASGATMAGALMLGAAAVMWLLGEFFARRRRLFLPAIAIVLAFSGFTVLGVLALYSGLILGREVDVNFDNGVMPPEVRNGILLTAAFGAIAPGAFYARFRLPFSIGLTGGGVAIFVIALIAVFAREEIAPFMSLLVLALGFALFAAGVAFDARDPMRTTRYSDNGFWLHVAAAPLILSGSFGLISQAFGGMPMAGGSAGLLVAAANPEGGNALGQAVATLGVIFVLGLVSVLINRRALIVGALITTGVALSVVFNEFGMGAGALIASVLLALGAFVLILGAGWASVRRALLGWVKPDGAWARIFPPADAPS